MYQNRTVNHDRSAEHLQAQIPSLGEELQLATFAPLPVEEVATAFCDPDGLSHINGYLFRDEDNFDNASFPFMQENYHKGDFLFAESPSHNREIRSLPSHDYQMEFADLSSFCPFENQPVIQAPRAFKPRTVKCRQLSLNKRFVMCTLQSYPQMLLRDQKSPPFLHPRQEELPGPLATCSGIVALWSVKNKNNSAFIWRSIQTEQVRLSEEVCFNL